MIDIIAEWKDDDAASDATFRLTNDGELYTLRVDDFGNVFYQQTDIKLRSVVRDQIAGILVVEYYPGVIDDDAIIGRGP